jgi:NAD+ synthase (glutamine-hydrolysing)
VTDERTTIDACAGRPPPPEFKRKQAAPGLKVTDRTFGTGWRMPIAARLT